MATNEPTTPREGTPIAARSCLPAFAIPDDAKIEEGRFAEFSVSSDAGAVEVSISRWYDSEVSVSCRGTAPALVGAGLFSFDWLVADRRTWCVVFEEAGPRLVVGGRGCPKGPYMNIRNERGTCDLRWKVAGPQRAEYAKRIEALWARSGGARKQEGAQKDSGQPWPPEVAHRAMCDRTENAIDLWKSCVEKTGCRFTDDSLNRINLAFEALRRAVSDGCVVVVQPELPRAGNVIYLQPGAH